LGCPLLFLAFHTEACLLVATHQKHGANTVCAAFASTSGAHVLMIAARHANTLATWADALFVGWAVDM
jgi:hypothetical protein